MKSLLVAVLVLLLTDGQCQSDQSVTKVEFVTMTRGYQKQLFFTADSVITIIDGRQEENKIAKRQTDPVEWAGFIKIVQDINLEEIAGLKSPSMRRAFDGARHSTITITTSDGREWKHSFDDEQPHDNLVPLMQAIMQADTGSSTR